MSNAIIFQKIFDEKWQQLPTVFKRHYAIRENSDDKIVAKGTISVDFSWLISLFRPIIASLNILPTKRAKNIPITVIFTCQKKPTAFCFNRIFYYPDKPFAFNSKQIPIGGNIMIEMTGGIFGWKCSYDYINNEVVLHHHAYVIKIFSWYVRIPLELVMGKCEAQEKAISDSAFQMKVQFTHFLFGFIYTYYGKFEVEQVTD
ncbi:MAG: DUF4166 domain-containing protein [Gammaproteobacteria bacterium]|nr:DUF4166 domain-containing protein [Gammaproteobacteria bacterium]